MADPMLVQGARYPLIHVGLPRKCETFLRSWRVGRFRFCGKSCLSTPMNQKPMFLDPSSQSNKGRKMLKFFCGLR